VQTAEETAYVMIGIGWRLFGPERFDQLSGIDRRKPVQHEVCEQQALFGPCQTLVDPAAVQGRHQSAAELDSVSLGVR